MRLSTLFWLCESQCHIHEKNVSNSYAALALSRKHDDQVIIYPTYQCLDSMLSASTASMLAKHLHFQSDTTSISFCNVHHTPFLIEPFSLSPPLTRLGVCTNAMKPCVIYLAMVISAFTKNSFASKRCTRLQIPVAFQQSLGTTMWYVSFSYS